MIDILNVSSGFIVCKIANILKSEETTVTPAFPVCKLCHLFVSVAICVQNHASF